MSKVQEPAKDKTTSPLPASDPKPVSKPVTSPTDGTTRTIPAPTTTNSPAIKNN
jgi:hypothetical protein